MEIKEVSGFKLPAKFFFTFLQSAYSEKQFPCVRIWYSQGWFTEDVRNNFQQEWIQVFEKIQETATIQQIIKICHLLIETEKPGNLCGKILSQCFQKYLKTLKCLLNKTVINQNKP